MLGGKAGSKVKPVSNGIRVDSSIYGAAIPVVIGRTRISAKMIFAGNYKTHKSSQKKGGGKKGQKQNSYSGNFDFLLGFAPIYSLGTIWRNKDNFWPVGVGSQTFPFIGSCEISNNPGPVVAIIGVTATQSVAETFNDYGAPGPVTVAGTQPLPIYPVGQRSIGLQKNIAPGGYDWGFWNTFGTWTLSSLSPATVTVTSPVSGPSVFGPVTVYYMYRIGSQTPMASAGLQSELILGTGTEFDYPGGSVFANQYPELSGVGASNLDLGTGNTAPNDNFEVISLYAVSSNGDANPADVILDVILPGNPTLINGSTSGRNWNHGLSCDITVAPGGNPTRPNILFDPPVPVV